MPAADPTPEPPPGPPPSVDVPDLSVLRTRTSAKWRMHPSDALPLSIAEMDVQLAPPVLEALVGAVQRGDTGYAWADPAYGQALAGFADRRWGWALDPDRVGVVPDVGSGAVAMLRSAAAPGHAVVVNPPVYPPFVDWVAEAGMRCAPVPLALDGGTWTLDLDGLERAFAAGAAAYLLCNPHNPVGRVHTPAELASVVDLARRYGVLVVSDEVHAPLTLPGAAFTPLLTVPGAAEVAVSLLSASKAFNLAGLKCAAVVSARGGPDTASILATSVWHCGHLGVVAGIAAFSHGDPWLDALLDLLVERRSELGGLLSTRLPTVSWQPPQATYLAWTDWRATGLADPGGALLAAGVALDPGPRFGPQGAGWMRLNFATSSALLDEATRRMAVALES